MQILTTCRMSAPIQQGDVSLWGKPESFLQACCGRTWRVTSLFLQLHCRLPLAGLMTALSRTTCMQLPSVKEAVMASWSRQVAEQRKHPKCMAAQSLACTIWRLLAGMKEPVMPAAVEQMCCRPSASAAGCVAQILQCSQALDATVVSSTQGSGGRGSLSCPKTTPQAFPEPWLPAALPRFLHGITSVLR